MSWEEHEILGELEDERPHEMFYENFIGQREEENDQEFETPENDFLSVTDIDFSSLEGKNLKSDFKKINRSVSGRKVMKRANAQRKPTVNPIKKVIVPRERKLIIEGVKKPVDKKAKTKNSFETLKTQSLLNKKKSRQVSSKTLKDRTNRSSQTTSKFQKKARQRIIVPDNRKVIVEGVDKFILSNTKESEVLRNIGYYQGEKLKELIFIINNSTPNDFDFELFNPSMPLDFLFSTSQNLNNRIAIAGDDKVSYSDVLFNMLANPTLLPNAKFTCSNELNPNQVAAQFNQPLIFKNKNIAGHEKIHPIQNALNFDNDQIQKTIIYWDIFATLGRAYIPDGMDIIKYKVLAGNTVVFGFYYKQVSLKRFFFKEARDKKIL